MTIWDRFRRVCEVMPRSSGEITEGNVADFMQMMGVMLESGTTKEQLSTLIGMAFIMMNSSDKLGGNYYAFQEGQKLTIQRHRAPTYCPSVN